jgi:hypothetical protein
MSFILKPKGLTGVEANPYENENNARMLRIDTIPMDFKKIDKSFSHKRNPRQ